MVDPSPYPSPDRRDPSGRRIQKRDRRLRSDRYQSRAHGEALWNFLGVWLLRGRYAWLVRLAILIMVVQWGFISVYYIPTRSMEPTLHGAEDWQEQDRVVVNKLAYGPRIPFTHKRFFATSSPKRFDIVLINLPGAPKDTPPLIKRVVGLPGEEVLVMNKRVLIDGEELKIPDSLTDTILWTKHLWVPEWKAGFKYLQLARFVLEEDESQLKNSSVIFRNSPILYELAKKETYRLSEKLVGVELSDVEIWDEERVSELMTQLDVDSQVMLIVRMRLSEISAMYKKPLFGTSFIGAETMVPEGNYFLLGDNGLESVDSRYYGWVEEDAFIGRAFATVYPLNRIRDLSGFTHKASGLIILWSFLIFFLLWELVPAMGVFNWRVRNDVSSIGLKTGDHLLVYRWPLGIYLPVIRRWVLWRDTLSVDDTVAFWIDAKRIDLGFGQVTEMTSSETYQVQVLSNGEEYTVEVAQKYMVGLPGRVWYPLGRRKTT